MAERFKALSAVFPLIFCHQGEQTALLLHRRQNTGWMDGKWDMAGSGHVDEGETALAALVRECREELGIEVNAEGVRFVHLSHRLYPDVTYYDIYFEVGRYGGTPKIMEPDKCGELKWFPVDALPHDMIECRRRAALAGFEGRYYSENVEKQLVEECYSL